ASHGRAPTGGAPTGSRPELRHSNRRRTSVGAGPVPALAPSRSPVTPDGRPPGRPYPKSKFGAQALACPVVTPLYCKLELHARIGWSASGHLAERTSVDAYCLSCF